MEEPQETRISPSVSLYSDFRDVSAIRVCLPRFCGFVMERLHAPWSLAGMVGSVPVVASVVTLFCSVCVSVRFEAGGQVLRPISRLVCIAAPQ